MIDFFRVVAAVAVAIAGLSRAKDASESTKSVDIYVTDIK